MDNTKSFYLLNVSSILASETNYGVVSVKVNTTDCDSVNMGSIPILLPNGLGYFNWLESGLLKCEFDSHSRPPILGLFV